MAFTKFDLMMFTKIMDICKCFSMMLLLIMFRDFLVLKIAVLLNCQEKIYSNQLFPHKMFLQTLISLKFIYYYFFLWKKKMLLPCDSISLNFRLETHPSFKIMKQFEIRKGTIEYTRFMTEKPCSHAHNQNMYKTI